MKLCPECKGSGRKLVKFEQYSGQFETTVLRCRRCHGRGYLSVLPLEPTRPFTQAELLARTKKTV